MTQTDFHPFDSFLDEGQALAELRAATDGADDGELFLERRVSESVSFDDGRVKSASYNAAEGFGLRAVRGEVTGYAHSTHMTIEALRRAAQTARLAVGAGGGTLADAPQPTNQRLYRDIDPVTEVAFAAKIDLLREIDDYLRAADPRVVQVSVALAATRQEIEILRPEGQRLRDARPMARLNISVIVEQDGRREAGGMGGGGRSELSALVARDHWRPVADEALRIALVNLRADPAPAGVMDVVLGPGWPGILLHEAIGHGLEGDFNRKGSSA
ncbi:MAG: metalloprotease TldD, partial [Alphaproteobacteria bacterium]|nr:metalloprotease TldD [Alphaproteobacteria bacterium]